MCGRLKHWVVGILGVLCLFLFLGCDTGVSETNFEETQYSFSEPIVTKDENGSVVLIVNVIENNQNRGVSASSNGLSITLDKLDNNNVKVIFANSLPLTVASVNYTAKMWRSTVLYVNISDSLSVTGLPSNPIYIPSVSNTYYLPSWTSATVSSIYFTVGTGPGAQTIPINNILSITN